MPTATEAQALSQDQILRTLTLKLVIDILDTGNYGVGNSPEDILDLAKKFEVYIRQG